MSTDIPPLEPINNAIIPPYVPAFGPTPNITPFTYRDGQTYLQVLEGMRVYLNQTIVPFINTSIDDLEEAFVDEVNRLIEAVNNAVDMVINSSIELQDPVMAAIVADLDSQTRVILEALYGDEAQADVIATVDSVTRLTLDGLYAGKKIEASVPLNVRDFGAVGDGVTDDTAAINEAVNAAEYHTLIFPYGTYVISDPIRLRNHTEIRGFNATLVRKNGYSNAILVNYDLGDTVTTGYLGNGNIKVSGFIFDGNQAAVSSNMVTFIHGHDIHIEDCIFIECTGTHFLEINSSKDCSVINSKFLGFIPDPALSFRKEAIQIDGAHDTLTGGGAKDGTASKNILISDCYFGPDSRGNGGPNICVGSHNIVANRYENVTVRNCVGEDLRAGGVWISYGGNWNVDGCRFTTVAKPVIHYNENTLVRRGVDIGSQTVDVKVSNTLVNSVDGCGVGIRGAAGDLIISNNLFYNGVNGIQIDASNYAIIEANLFYRTSGPTVTIFSSNHVTVSNNLIRGACYPAGGNGVFTVDGTVEATSKYNNFVSNIYLPNTATDPGAGVYSVAGFGGSSGIMNNRFRGLALVNTGASTDVVLTNTLL